MSLFVVLTRGTPVTDSSFSRARQVQEEGSRQESQGCRGRRGRGGRGGEAQEEARVEEEGRQVKPRAVATPLSSPKTSLTRFHAFPPVPYRFCLAFINTQRSFTPLPRISRYIPHCKGFLICRLRHSLGRGTRSKPNAEVPITPHQVSTMSLIASFPADWAWRMPSHSQGAAPLPPASTSRQLPQWSPSRPDRIPRRRKRGQLLLERKSRSRGRETVRCQRRLEGKQSEVGPSSRRRLRAISRY